MNEYCTSVAQVVFSEPDLALSSSVVGKALALASFCGFEPLTKNYLLGKNCAGKLRIVKMTPCQN